MRHLIFRSRVLVVLWGLLTLCTTNAFALNPGTWSKITSLDGISDGDLILITSYKSSKAGNASGTNYYSVPGGKTLASLTLSNNLPSGIDDTKCWKFVSAGTNQYYIMNGTNYMYFNSSNDGVKCGTTKDIMTISVYQTNYFSIKDGTNNRYFTLYSTSDWRCYTSQYDATTSQNSRLTLYKWTPASTKTTVYLDTNSAHFLSHNVKGHPPFKEA